MEKYYIVPKENSLHKEYNNYLENSKQVNEVVKKFMTEHDIETSQYCCTSDSIYIVPTEKDAEKFGKVLSKPISDGLQMFRKNSKIGKAWNNMGVKVSHKPMVGFYFKNIYGRHRTRLFNYEDKLYCAIEGDYNDIEPIEYMIEIKASEFHAIMESM